MRTILLFILFFPCYLLAQVNTTDTVCYTVAQKDTLYKPECPSILMPEFPGGESALLKFVASNTLYPKQALALDVSGKVFVNFVIEKDGRVGQVEIHRGVNPPVGKNEEEQRDLNNAALMLEQEALRVIRMLPKWEPGVENGKPIRVMYTIPINFKLN
jgi:periplasmic protein TonB